MRIHYPEFVWEYHIPTRSYRLYILESEEDAMKLALEPKVVLTRRAYDELKHWMVENDPHGVIRTDRKEDLKIIHKTLDIIQSLSEKAKKGGEE